MLPITLAATLLAVTSALNAPAAPQQSAAYPAVVCQSSALTAYPGQSVVTLDAIIVSAKGASTKKGEWTVDRGKLQQQNATEATWDLSDSPEGYVQATFSIQNGHGGTEQCIASVRVLLKARGQFNSGRSLLIRGDLEEMGAGLYTYLLFRREPTNEEKPKYRAAVDAILRILPEVEAFHNRIPLARRNQTYLLLKSAPEGETANDRAKFVDWIVEHYDYDTAKVIGATYADSSAPTILLLSSRQPLADEATRPGQVLRQNLSAIPESVMSLWVEKFLRQVETSGLAHASDGSTLLVVRTAIAAAADALPPVRTALDDWISWIKKIAK